MKRIAVVTATMAEYGLLAPVIRKLREHENDEFIVELVVTGTHLNAKYGYTLDMIDMRIDHVIPISVDSDSALDISKNQADVLIKFTELFSRELYDAVILLGDRYETLAMAIAAGNTRTPVFHLCGGDTTEGALDEWIRHSVTKISYLHFVTNEESRCRVIQLGENPERVFNFGSTSIDNILAIADMTKKEALESIGLGECSYALCTFHPVTMENENIEEQIRTLMEVIKRLPWIQFIITKANADQGGGRINEMLDSEGAKIDNMHVYASLGEKRYLSLMRYAIFVLGNSSSGIIEAPSFHIPTINVGERQRGRLQSASIINCGLNREKILNAVSIAMSEKHQAICKTVISPYGDGHAADRIATKIVEIVNNGNIDLKKKFYDIANRGDMFQ